MSIHLEGPPVPGGHRRRAEEIGALQPPHADVRGAGGRRRRVRRPGREEHAAQNDGPDVEDAGGAEGSAGVHDAGGHQEDVDDDHGSGERVGLDAVREEEEGDVDEQDHGERDTELLGQQSVIVDLDPQYGSQYDKREEHASVEHVVQLFAEVHCACSSSRRW